MGTILLLWWGPCGGIWGPVNPYWFCCYIWPAPFEYCCGGQVTWFGAEVVYCCGVKLGFKRVWTRVFGVVAVKIGPPKIVVISYTSKRRIGIKANHGVAVDRI